MSDEAKRIVAEETWDDAPGSEPNVSRSRAVGGDGWMASEVNGDFYRWLVLEDGMDSPVAARIAACAPEALRMLLANGCHDAGCIEAHGCAADCSWLALMRKAGLRE